MKDHTIDSRAITNKETKPAQNPMITSNLLYLLIIIYIIDNNKARAKKDIANIITYSIIFT